MSVIIGIILIIIGIFLILKVEMLVQMNFASTVGFILILLGLVLIGFSLGLSGKPFYH